MENKKQSKIERSRIIASGKIKCVKCGLPVYRGDFRTQYNFNVWVDSGLCQICQNKKK